MVHQKQGAHNNESLEKWLVGQAVKTPASHAGNAGSIPARVTRKRITSEKMLNIYVPYTFETDENQFREYEFVNRWTYGTT